VLSRGHSGCEPMLPVTLQFIISMVAHALNERMARRVEYLQEEVRVLREALATVTGKSRISFTPEQRRPGDQREGVDAGRAQGLLSDRSPCGNPRVVSAASSQQVRRLEGSSGRASAESCGHPRARARAGARKPRLGLHQDPRRAARTQDRDRSDDVANVLAEAGLEPAPERTRKRSWKQFLRSHWETLYACDFFAVETLGAFGTVRRMVFFIIELKSRAVQIAGIGIAPDGAWMAQVARNLVDPMDGFLRNATHLIHDRDPLFTRAWTELLESSGVKSVPIPAQSPNCNCYAERFVRTIRAECLAHFVIFGERHLRYLVQQFVEHYQAERYHQGIGGQLIQPRPGPSNDNARLGPIGCRSRLGGVLNFYHQEAA
jgi:putative transposase